MFNERIILLLKQRRDSWQRFHLMRHTNSWEALKARKQAIAIEALLAKEGVAVTTTQAIN